jgi:hypothetical protein
MQNSRDRISRAVACGAGLVIIVCFAHFAAAGINDDLIEAAEVNDTEK